MQGEFCMRSGLHDSTAGVSTADSPADGCGWLEFVLCGADCCHTITGTVFVTATSCWPAGTQQQQTMKATTLADGCTVMCDSHSSGSCADTTHRSC